MTTSINDLLKDRTRDEPPEIAIIKKFVQTEFGESCSVQFHENQIIIGVSSASLAGALRLRLHELQTEIGVTRHLSIRIV